MAKKLKIDTIDENFIINSFRQDEPVSPTVEKQAEVREEDKPGEEEIPMPPKPSVEETRRRKQKTKDGDYQELFSKKLKYPPVSEKRFMCEKSIMSGYNG